MVTVFQQHCGVHFAIRRIHFSEP